ncbi:MAG: hypothetical protein ACREFZ_07080 [Acetobacteraceae bacterium]
MPAAYNTLILGASYGSLLGAKLLLAGHNVTLVCLPEEAAKINQSGARVQLPVKGRQAPIEIDSRKLPGRLSATTPNAADPSRYDLVCLAMQEPQYGASGVRELLDTIAKAKKPCMSIMNMPPLTYLRRIPGLDVEPLRSSYTDPSVWQNFEPGLMTLCSPDPQAYRPDPKEVNVLKVTLPTNFKAARFVPEAPTEILRRMQADIEAIRYDAGDAKIDLPVKLKVHESVFVPLAKWAMLICGNYRCVQKDEARSIKDAVHSDLATSRAVYDWVRDVCIKFGAAPGDLVPFEKYANAALSLTRPSSAARALFASAPHIERVDRLVQSIAAQKGMHSAVLDETVALVDARLALSQKQAA